MPAAQSAIAPPAKPIGDPVRAEADPSCTGTFVSKPENVRTDGGADIVQATYLRENDGTPWLRLRIGNQRRIMLTGLAVERITFRATVMTRLPRGTTHVAGTTSGTYGTIDYVCAGSARDAL